MICTGGLFYCSLCGLTEGCLTTECCGVPSYVEKGDLVYTGRLDFYGGRWVKLPSIHCPAYWSAHLGEGRDWDRELSPVCTRRWPDTIRESWERERYDFAVTQYKNLNSKVIAQQWGSLPYRTMRDMWELDFLKDWDCHEREQ